jgi:hypothetical protein
MKLKITELKAILEGSKENKLVDNMFNYYFEGRFVPAVITENKIVFYVPGSQQYFISEYALDKTGISLDGVKKLSFEKEIVEDAESKDSQFKGISQNVFEIDEDRKTFSESLKKMKKMISTNESVINEDVYLDRIKEMAMSKAKTFLMKPQGGTTDNWKGNNENEFKKNMESCSAELWKDLNAKVKENISGKTIASHYDMYDINKIKFNYEDGKGVYKQLKIELPKSKLWIAENKTLLDTATPDWKIDAKNDYSIVDDTKDMIKKKKYCEKEEQCPESDRVSDLLVAMKNSQKICEMWKSNVFKKTVKDLYENEIEVEEFVRKYEGFAFVSEEKTLEVFEKALVDIYSDASKLEEAKKIASVMTFAMEETGVRKAIVEDILKTEISDVNGLIEDLSALSEAIRDYKSPEDDNMKYVEGLMNTVSDVFSRYREKDMDESTGRVLAVMSEKLNDIWARQRITDEDKKFLKTISEKIEGIEEEDRKFSTEIQKTKDNQREGFGKFEDDILKKNTIEMGTEKK